MELSGLCDICGNFSRKLFTCNICGTRCCSNCFISNLGVCKRCAKGKHGNKAFKF